MGNHAAGRDMGLLAELAVKDRKPGESALEILDRICERYRGCDAEFEAEDPHRPGKVHPDYDEYTVPHPKAALGLLLVEAFAPHGLADMPRYAPLLEPGDPQEEAACDAWWTEVYERFRARYQFC